MAAKGGAVTLTEGDLHGLVAARVGGGFSKTDVRNVIKALKDEIAECLQQGYKVNLAGLVIITPSAKEGRKKGTVVRNPFDGTEKTLRADEPDKFVVKARVSQGVVGGFPSVRSKAGTELIAQLKPKAKAAAKGKGKR